MIKISCSRYKNPKLTLSVFASIFLFTAANALASGTSFFTVSSSGSSLQIQATQYHNYPNAGIKINTPGYSLADIGTDCSMATNGYCIFSVNNQEASNIQISGSAGDVNISLCLNGQAQASCQSYTVTLTPNIYSSAVY
jgi:hypothetical protein